MDFLAMQKELLAEQDNLSELDLMKGKANVGARRQNWEPGHFVTLHKLPNGDGYYFWRRHYPSGCFGPWTNRWNPEYFNATDWEVFEIQK